MPRTKQTARKTLVIPSRASRPPYRAARMQAAPYPLPPSRDEQVQQPPASPDLAVDPPAVPVSVFDHSTLCSHWGYREEKFAVLRVSTPLPLLDRMRALMRIYPSLVEELVRRALVSGLCFCRDAPSVADFVLSHFDAEM